MNNDNNNETPIYCPKLCDSVGNYNSVLVNEPIVEQLRRNVKSSSLSTRIEEIYRFGKSHPNSAIQACLMEYGLKVTNLEDRFESAAKLGLSICLEGEWLTCTTEALLYADVCRFLELNRVEVEEVENFIKEQKESKNTHTGQSSSGCPECQFRLGLMLLEKIYSVELQFREDDDEVRLIPYSCQSNSYRMIVPIKDFDGDVLFVRTPA